MTAALLNLQPCAAWTNNAKRNNKMYELIQVAENSYYIQSPAKIGIYKLNETELFITNGIGNSKYPFRLFNHPSINFIRLKTKTS